MITLLLLLYIVPVYLVFFHFKVLPFTRLWKIVVATPPVAGLLFLWFAFGRYTPAAEDAYAQANVVQIAAQVSGPVVKVHVTDNAMVRKGDPLFEIDSAPYRHTFLQAQASWIAAQESAGGLLGSLASADAAVEKSEAALEVSRQTVLQAQAQWIAAQETAAGLLGSLASLNAMIEQGEATLEGARQNAIGAKANIQAAAAATAKAKAQLDLAEIDLKRYSSIVGTGAVTQQQVDKAAQNVDSAKASLEQGQQGEIAARAALAAAESQVVAAVAAVTQARAERAKIEVQIDPLGFAQRLLARGDAKSPDKVIADKMGQLLDKAKAAEDILQGRNPSVIAAQAALGAAKSQVVAADAAVTQARAERMKIEVQIDPVASVQGLLSRGVIKSPGELIADMMGQLLDRAKVAAGILQGRFPSVIQAEEAMNQAKYNLDRTTITAPCDGIVGQVQLSVGTFVGAGVPVIVVTDTAQWRLLAAVPENWLKLVRPGDQLLYSFRNYPLRVRKGTVDAVSRGVIQGQGVPTGTLPDPDPRRMRQTNTPGDQSDFFVTVLLSDDQPNEPLRVGATGRVTIFASGGFPVVNTLATVFHYISSLSDCFYPKPSLITILVIVGAIVGVVYLVRRKRAKKTHAQDAPSSESESRDATPSTV